MVSLNKSVLVHAMKAYTGSRGMIPLILNLGNRWRKAVSVMPRLYSRGKQPRYPPNWKLLQINATKVHPSSSTSSPVVVVLEGGGQVLFKALPLHLPWGTGEHNRDPEYTGRGKNWILSDLFIFFNIYRCIVHFDICRIHSPTNPPFNLKKKTH